LSAREKFISGQTATAAAKEALRYANEKYKVGKSSVYDYNEARLKAANVLSEQAQAKYELMLQMYLLNFYAGNPIEQ
jgi:outer membrane protein